MKTLKKFLWLAAICGLTLPAYSLTIIPTFDGSITNDPNGAAMVAAITNAINALQTKITGLDVVKIHFTNDPAAGLGESDTWLGDFSYSAYLTALKRSATSVNDTNALSSIPNSSTDPILGQNQIQLQLALAVHMGLASGYGPDGFDSTILLNTSIMNFSRPPQDSSKYDMQQVVEHEMDEVLGTPSGVGGTLICPPDLFRYSTNTSGLSRTFTTSGDNAYFSPDATNLLARYNMNASGDYGDWWSLTGNWAPPGQTPHVQVQDAFTPPDTQMDVGVSELTMLDIIGWTLVTTSTNSPALMIVRNSANQYMFSWTNTATGFILQERTNLIAGAWANSLTGSTNPAVITSTNAQKFYRLFEASSPSVLTSQAELSQVVSGSSTPLQQGIHVLHRQ